MTAEQLHKAIFNSFKVTDEIQFAQQFERLLNYILYDKDIKPKGRANSMTKALDELLNEDIKAEIKSRLVAMYPELSENFTGADLFSSSTIKTGDMLENLLGELGKVLAETTIDVSEIDGWDTMTAVTGRDRRIIQIPNVLVKSFFKTVGRKIYEDMPADTWYSTSKQMKADINYNNLSMNVNINGKINPWVEKLLTTALSAKNYNSLPVHLEKIYVGQAYAGIVDFLSANGRKRNFNEILNLYTYYMEHDAESAFFAHLSHIIRIQALVGAGQTQVDTKAAITRGPAVIPDYLIINVRAQNKIYVRSTHAIIQSMQTMYLSSDVTPFTRIGVGYTVSGGSQGKLYHE